MQSLLRLSVLTMLVVGLSGCKEPVLQVPEAALPHSSKAAALTDTSVYIVQLADAPVAGYEGGLRDLVATKPARGEKVARGNRDVQRYVDELTQRHDDVLTRVGASAGKIYDYLYAFNGIAAELTPTQAQALTALPEVRRVWPDEKRYAVTDSTPSFLGLDDVNEGLWAARGLDGEDVIVGVIDTGIWPEHPSFSDTVPCDELDASPNGSLPIRSRECLVYTPPPATWQGICQRGERWAKTDCNHKLIGARYFFDGYTRREIIGDDYRSARDASGHGSHVASTAAGNGAVDASLFGVPFGEVSGIAPRARVAMYKALWNDTGGYVSDLAAAIDAAVGDGVDVINYSIGSSAAGLVAPDDIAFLYASQAGVYVAVAAGNDGPDAATVGSPANAPWVTSVGASMDNDISYLMLGVTSPASVAGNYFAQESAIGVPLLLSGETAGALVRAEPLDGCTALANSAAIAGNIAFIQRGTCAFSDKHLNAQAAGARAVVVFNNVAGAPIIMGGDASGITIPGEMVSLDDGLLLADALEAGDAVQVVLSWYNRQDRPDLAGVMADFSSRGPNRSAEDLIKPDVTAPGVDILAAQTPTPFPGTGPSDQLFQIIGGTSMASPHVAGIGALLRQAHPDWTPAMIKSALMTSAYQAGMRKEDETTPADPFDMGAGHVRPNGAYAPGLVYDVGFYDYLGFLCGVTDAVAPSTCDALAGLGYALDPRELNVASLGVAKLVGEHTVTRTVTNVGPGATYAVAVDAPWGIDVTVTPPSMTLASGESAAYTVTLATTDAATLGMWGFGAITWSDGAHAVRSPLAARPVALDAPDEVVGIGSSGELSFDVGFGYSGDYAALPHGLVAADRQAGNVVDDPANDINTALASGVGVTFHPVEVPVGTLLLRAALFDAYTDGADDLDLYVFGPDTAGYPLIGSSGSGTSAERVEAMQPEAGLYLAAVHGWQTDGPDANYTLFAWNVGEDLGNMSVAAPTSAVRSSYAPVAVTWTDLTVGTKYLGAITHHDGVGMIAVTRVGIDTDAP